MLEESHIAHRSLVRELAYARIEPIVQEVDSTSELHRGVISILAQAGLFRIVIPVEQGGLGISLRSICVTREALSEVSGHADSAFAMQGLGSYPITLAGSDEQKKHFLPGVANGSLIAAFAITEPEAGSDVASVATSAKANGDVYIVNGAKRFISNAGDADFYVLFAKTDESQGRRGLSALILPADTSGLEIDRSMHLVAEHPIGSLTMRDARLSRDFLLGNEGSGFEIAMRTLDVFRASVGAAAVGMAQRAINEAVSYSKARVQFGKPIADQPVIQYKLADMAVELAAARLLVYDAATLFDRGSAESGLSSSIAKLYATESAQRIIDAAVQIHGGSGLVRGAVVERLYREIRPLRIYEGTSEIQHMIIARHLLRNNPAVASKGSI